MNPNWRMNTYLTLAVVSITLWQLCPWGNTPWHLLNTSKQPCHHIFFSSTQRISLVKEKMSQVFNIIWGNCVLHCRMVSGVIHQVCNYSLNGRREYVVESCLLSGTADFCTSTHTFCLLCPLTHRRGLFGIEIIPNLEPSYRYMPF